MSVSSVAVTPQPCETFLNQLWGCCSTDTKIYALLVVGRVLQAAAVASLATASFCAFFVTPFALVGLIPAFVFWMLGMSIADNPSGTYEGLQVFRPFVPGQPVGLMNEKNNCWLNVGLQMLAHVPRFRARASQIPEFASFLQAYDAARSGCHKVAPSINSQQIRQFLSRETGGLIAPRENEEDAVMLFEYLFQGNNSLYRFDQSLDGVPSTSRREPMIQLELGEPSFDLMMERFFNSRTDTGRQCQLAFPTAPQDLLIQMKRFRLDPATGSEVKLNDALDIPERINLPTRYVRSRENASYQCDAFLLHQGATLKSGHYVIYLNIGGTWWRCSDSQVVDVSTKEALDAMKYSYISHYSKS